VAGVALALVSSRRASAGERRPVALTYRAPAECPGAASFREQVYARTQLAELSDHGAPLTVTIRLEGRTFVGTLETEGGSARRARSLSDARCTDLVTALALSAALAIDPEASMAPAVASVEPPPPAPAPPGPSTTPSALLRAAPPSEPPAPAAMREERTRSGHGVRVGWEPAVGYELNGAMGPAVLGGVNVRGPELRAGGRFGPALRVAFAGLSSGLALAESPLATFTLLRTRAWLTAFGVGAGAFEVRPALGLGVGWLSARGLAVTDPRASGSGWVEIAAALEARVSVGRGFVALHGGALVPLTTTTFVFDGPRRVVHETARVGALAAIDLGLHIW